MKRKNQVNQALWRPEQLFESFSFPFWWVPYLLNQAKSIVRSGLEGSRGIQSKKEKEQQAGVKSQLHALVEVQFEEYFSCICYNAKTEGNVALLSIRYALYVMWPFQSMLLLIQRKLNRLHTRYSKEHSSIILIRVKRHLSSFLLQFNNHCSKRKKDVSRN